MVKCADGALDPVPSARGRNCVCKFPTWNLQTNPACVGGPACAWRPELAVEDGSDQPDLRRLRRVRRVRIFIIAHLAEGTTGVADSEVVDPTGHDC